MKNARMNERVSEDNTRTQSAQCPDETKTACLQEHEVVCILGMKLAQARVSVSECMSFCCLIILI